MVSPQLHQLSSGQQQPLSPLSSRLSSPETASTASSSTIRTRRTRPQPLAKGSPNAAARAISAPTAHHQLLHMAMSNPSVPHYRPARRRSSAQFSHHVHHSTMATNQSGRPVFTRTGRVSKALKGLKVHECDQCGKVCALISQFHIPPSYPLLHVLRAKIATPPISFTAPLQRCHSAPVD